MVTVPIGPPGQQRRTPGRGEMPTRPRALTAGTSLLLAAALPFLALGVAAAALPEARWMPRTGPWPRLHANQFGYRVLGVALLLCAFGYVTLAVLAHWRRHWARTALATVVALADPAVLMLLLADAPPRPGWSVFGGVVVLCSLAGVVCSYQPEVDLYLADRGRHAC